MNNIKFITRRGILPVCLLWASAVFAHDSFPYGSPLVTSVQQVSMRGTQLLGIHFQPLFFSQPGKMEADTVVPKGVLPAGKRKNDPFSILMAGVVNDTAVLYNTYVDEIPIKDSIKTELAKAPPVKIDSPMVAVVQKKPAKDGIQKIDSSQMTSVQKEPVKDNTQKKALMGKTSVAKAAVKTEAKKPDSTFIHAVSVEKLSESLQDSVLELVYVTVSRDGKQDTVNMTIALDKTKKELVTQTQEPVIKKTIPAETAKDSTRTEEKEKKLEKEEDLAKKNIDSVRKTENTLTGKEVAVDSTTNTHPELSGKMPKAEKPATIIHAKDSSVKHEEVSRKTTAGSSTNTNCKNAATDIDVDKLRVKMMAADYDEDKLLIARKVFRTRCFTTLQVKALSEIFPTDEGRYKLFDTAYPFVSDYDNFPQLSGLLTSQYYINRFKAMLK